MNKMSSFKFLLILIAGIIMCFPSFSNAQGTFWVEYIAPGYTASEFLILEFPTAAIEFDPEGNLLTSDGREFGSGLVNILMLEAPEYISASTYVSFSTSGYGLNGLDFDDAGNLFASEFSEIGSPDPPFDTDSGLIRRIDDMLNVSDPILFPDFRPTGIAAIFEGELYFPGRKWSDPYFGNIYKIGSFPGTKEIVYPDLVATGIAIDDWGRVFVATPDGSVYTRDPVTDEPLLVVTFNKMAEELNFDSEGNLYALEMKQGISQSTIIKISYLPDDILDFFDKSVEDGSLKGRGFGWLAKLRLYFMRSMLVIAGELIERDLTKAACFTLQRAYLRCDSEFPPLDFVEGDATEQLASMIQELRTGMGCDD